MPYRRLNEPPSQERFAGPIARNDRIAVAHAREEARLWSHIAKTAALTELTRPFENVARVIEAGSQDGVDLLVGNEPAGRDPKAVMRGLLGSIALSEMLLMDGSSEFFSH